MSYPQSLCLRLSPPHCLLDVYTSSFLAYLWFFIDRQEKTSFLKIWWCSLKPELVAARGVKLSQIALARTLSLWTEVYKSVYVSDMFVTLCVVLQTRLLLFGWCSFRGVVLIRRGGVHSEGWCCYDSLLSCYLLIGMYREFDDLYTRRISRAYRMLCVCHLYLTYLRKRR